MAGAIAAPLERRLASVASVTEIFSSSTDGETQITMQFDINRKVDAAARDVQAAINAASSDLPLDLPTRPFFRKVNPAAAPVLVIALTSETLTTSAIYDTADSVIAQRISRVSGVAEVRISGAEQPAVYIETNPSRVAAMGIGIDQVARAVIGSNVLTPVGAFDGRLRSETIATSDNLSTPDEFRNIVVSTAHGAIVKLGDIANVDLGVRNRLSAGWFNGKPAVLLTVIKRADANVIETVDHIKELLPKMREWIPNGVELSVLSDRTQAIRASVSETTHTLLISICLLMTVVFLFMRRATPTLAAGVSVPLSMAGIFAAMWMAGFSLDNLSLMALTVSVGFVVDDAIVMVENIESNIERGISRFKAALVGASQVGFTIISLSLSILAVFTPVLFMDGIIGRALHEFSFTLIFGVLTSIVVSLTVTPMVCAHVDIEDCRPRLVGQIMEEALSGLTRLYERSLRSVVDHPWASLLVIVIVIGSTVYLYRTIPKAGIPQGDIGLINGRTEAAAGVSFAEMVRLQKEAADLISADPEVANVGSSIGGSPLNEGQFFVALKMGNRQTSTTQVIDRLRKKLSNVSGLTVFLTPVQDLNANVRQSKSQFQFTLSGPSLPELEEWFAKVLARVQTLPELVDVSTDHQQGGLKANLVIDRVVASRLGVSIQSIDAALNTAFGQRQDSFIYTPRNQYRVVFAVPPSFQRDPGDLSGIYVSAAGGKQVPLMALARVDRATMSSAVNHRGVLPSATITYNIAPDSNLDAATNAIQHAVAEMRLPDNLHADFAGDAANFRKISSGLPLLLIIAIVSVYLVLGLLYESLVHPITILMTLPSAGLGALLALKICKVEFSLIAFIGVLLLIGLVMKNGIIMVDFALHAQRESGLSIRDAALKGAKDRFRPILMTTLAAILGALPLIFADGIGAELRRPLGITIVGGLLLSQALTLYTTPVIYLMMSRFDEQVRKTGASFARHLTCP